ncbi:MAG: polyribonucleotide nucleotidyltransferase [Bacteroidetes bacterium CG23_combo_of_CG06-09_8_20_14_all_32_9]|nr:MAG: polyribonucleotide nucleotidyltransferase [Bacteroidetes bacterium CG23_combo_of_CG06-09_8_20_14_all_32_9]
MYNAVKKTIQLNDGRIIEIETGKLAKQADGSVVLKMGKTMLLATVVSAKEAKENVDFMPLSVDYREKYASTGRFPGGFMKREARPSDYEILISRLVDRVLRPLFPDDYHAETFVNIDLISCDTDDLPDALVGLAASAAITVSNIPFHGPISEVRVAKINGKLVINPSHSSYKNADLDLMVGATYDNILMVEGELNEISEEDMIEAIRFAHQTIKIQCKAQMELAEQLAVTKRVYCHENNNEEIKTGIRAFAYQKIYDVIKKGIVNKQERSDALHAICDEFMATLAEPDESTTDMVNRYYNNLEKEAFREYYFTEQVRLDGRKFDQIRPIWSEVDFLPMAHGSAIFTRGETQSLASVTLGNKLDEQHIDGAVFQGYERFLLNYNFPPYSTGEARPYRGVGRREVGHGNLAHRALKRMIPTDYDINPYTIRVVSDILESNGSSSMATVCAATLALMDAGIKIKKPVTGIAMGLISDPKTGRFIILSDILGDEDHFGDMDFKVCGTPDGITATQMDIKVDGLPYEVLAKALTQARVGRLYILEKILKTLPEPRPDFKPHAPRIVSITVPKDMIGAIIGPGGKIIQDIQAKTNTIITIDEVEDHGIVQVCAPDADSIKAAIKRIKGIIGDLEIGEVFDATVKSIMEYGAFVEIFPGKEGLLHISEIEWRHLKKVEDALHLGQKIQVKLLDIDNRGKMKLSRKVLLPKPEEQLQSVQHEFKKK